MNTNHTLTNNSVDDDNEPRSSRIPNRMISDCRWEVNERCLETRIEEEGEGCEDSRFTTKCRSCCGDPIYHIVCRENLPQLIIKLLSRIRLWSSGWDVNWILMITG